MPTIWIFWLLFVGLDLGIAGLIPRGIPCIFLATYIGNGSPSSPKIGSSEPRAIKAFIDFILTEKAKIRTIMNGGGGGGRRIPTMPLDGRKDIDEDLFLFRELHKREKDWVGSLLQPVSDDFEPNGGGTGNYALYRVSSGKKGSGYEFFGENDKNDYDWLKTPPATPLFPSLEMEANAPQLVIQREIPILQPLSRFAGNNSQALKGGRPKTPNPKPKIPPRSVIPSQRPTSISSTDFKNIKPTQIPNHKLTALTTDLDKRTNPVMESPKSTNQKESHNDFLTSNLSKNTGKDSKAKLRSRGVSPSVRSTIPAQIPGFSNETPPNLRTDRSTSASRGRPGNPALPIHQKPEPTTKPSRQSCSPSVTRGRKFVESKQESGGNLSTQKGRIQTGNGTQILGSRMVDKVMNARKSGAEERETKPKLRGSINESSGLGRLNMSKSSLDMPLEHTDIKRDRINSRRLGTFPAGKGFTRE